MNFNPKASTEAQEVIFTWKVKKVVQPPIFFNNKPVQQVPPQNHLGLILDISWTFDEHMKAITIKFSKTMSLLPKLNNIYHGTLLLQFINHSWGLT